MGERYQTKLCIELSDDSINNFLQECVNAHETCDVLYQLKPGDAHAFKDRIRTDHRIEYIAIVDWQDSIAAVARISRSPNVANGKIGYFVGPTSRRQGFGKMILQEATKFAIMNDIYPVTLVVGDMNAPSIHTVLACGYIPTGNVYEWTPNPKPRKGIEFEFNADCKGGG